MDQIILDLASGEVLFAYGKHAPRAIRGASPLSDDWWRLTLEDGSVADCIVRMPAAIAALQAVGEI
jgi:hypothetical protein